VKNHPTIRHNWENSIWKFQASTQEITFNFMSMIANSPRPTAKYNHYAYIESDMVPMTQSIHIGKTTEQNILYFQG